MEPQFEIHGDFIPQLFSIRLLIDEDLRIHEFSDVLGKYMPEVDRSALLTDIFYIQRPAAVVKSEDILDRIDGLFLMSAKSGNFAVRGQFFRGRVAVQNMLLFLGAPWLNWMQSKFPDQPLELNDFAVQDTQLDELLLLSTSSSMIADLEELNDELKQAKLVAENAQQARIRFFNQMSHELRTPLNGVGSALALLSECSLEKDVRDLVRLAESSAQHMVKVVNQALETSAIESKERQTQFKWFELQAMIDDVCDIVRPIAVEKSLCMDIKVDPRVNPWIHSEQDRIHQTLLNLLVNAVKFTEQGGVTLKVLPVVSATPTEAIRFEVADTGVGISEEDMEHIFAPFWRSQSSSQQAFEAGSGLGLYIVSKGVESLDGQLGAESELGVGSNFWMELPVQTAAQAEFQSRLKKLHVGAAVEGTADAPQLSGRILIVDDNPTSLILGGMLIQSISPQIEVDTAANGRDAVASICSNEYELVFMDLNLPDIQGREAVVEAAKTKGSCMPPVVALTAHTDDNERRLCADVGMVGFLVKPLSKDDLRRALETHMANQSESGRPPSLLDVDVLDALRRDIGDDLVLQIIEEFLEEAGSKRNRLQDESADNDAAEIAAIAHSLASSCKSFGLTSVGDDLLQLEKQIKANSIANLAEDLQLLLVRFDQGVKELTLWKS